MQGQTTQILKVLNKISEYLQWLLSLSSINKNSPYSIHSLLDGLEHASDFVLKLQKDKFSLKEALKDTLEKKSSLFKQAKAFQQKYSEAKHKNLSLRGQIEKLESSQRLFEELRVGLMKRDQIIKNLKTEKKHVLDSESILNAIDILTPKISMDSQISPMFQKCSRNFQKLRNDFSVGKIQECLKEALEFIDSLVSMPIHNQYISQLDSFDPIQTTSDILCNSSEFEVFNQEMLQTIQRSNEMLTYSFNDISISELEPDVRQCSVDMPRIEAIRQPRVLVQMRKNRDNGNSLSSRIPGIRKGVPSFSEYSQQILVMLYFVYYSISRKN